MRRYIAVFALLASFSSPARAVTRYTLTDVSSLGGYASGVGHINNEGALAGSVFADGAYRAFAWNNDVTTIIDTPGIPSFAWGLNDSGLVVGPMYMGQATWHGFVWTGSTVTDVGTLGGDSTYALGINNFGQVIGYSTLPGWTYHAAFVWQSGVMQMLGPVNHSSDAYAINDAGWVAGRIDYDAVVWIDGTPTSLGLSTGTASTAQDVNDSGSIVGEWIDGSIHAFLWKAGSATDLTAYLDFQDTRAYAINNSGLVVGQAVRDRETIQEVRRAVIWENGTVYDLNDLVIGGSGAELDAAGDINDSGSILASGWVDGVAHTFLLTPVPEPSSLLALACGIAGLGGLIRRRQKE